MPTAVTDRTLAPELEAIAQAASDQIHAEIDDNSDHDPAQLRQRVADAARDAIAAGAALGAIAAAEQAGQQRARSQLGPDALKRIAKAAARKRAADDEHEREIIRAAKLGLAYRDIATAGEIAPATVRSLLTRTEHTNGHHPDDHPTVSDNGNSDPHAQADASANGHAPHHEQLD